MPRNSGVSLRHISGNAARTLARKEQYYGLEALLETWESRPMAVQCRNHEYILKLRAKLRAVKNSITHRAGPDGDL